MYSMKSVAQQPWDTDQEARGDKVGNRWCARVRSLFKHLDEILNCLSQGVAMPHVSWRPGFVSCPGLAAWITRLPIKFHLSGKQLRCSRQSAQHPLDGRFSRVLGSTACRCHLRTSPHCETEPEFLPVRQTIVPQTTRGTKAGASTTRIVKQETLKNVSSQPSPKLSFDFFPKSTFIRSKSGRKRPGPVPPPHAFCTTRLYKACAVDRHRN